MLLLLPLLFILELGYLYLADRFNIIDKPNQRSSHTRPTVRGGGIIFPIAWLLFSAWNGWVYSWFTAGVALIAGVSFWDDLRPIPVRLRLLAHVAAFTLLFVELQAFQLLPWWVMALAYVLGIGIINAYNFMDGINGITGLYTLAIFVPLLLVGPGLTGLIDSTQPLAYLIPAILVFGFFNFRRRSRCFAGDVGSVPLGFIVLFFLLGLFLGEELTGGVEHPSLIAAPSLAGQYILLLTVYGVDTVLTILYRLGLRENIFRAHRRHLYQYLANECRWPHLGVAGLYAGIQLAINAWVFSGPIAPAAAIALPLALGVVYVGVRVWLARARTHVKTL